MIIILNNIKNQGSIQWSDLFEFKTDKECKIDCYVAEIGGQVV